MERFVTLLNDILWGPWLVYGILIVGVLFSIMTRFVQVRLVKDSCTVNGKRGEVK